MGGHSSLKLLNILLHRLLFGLEPQKYCTSCCWDFFFFWISQARDVYEEAIQTVTTVRDFTQVFDSYAQFEESVIAAKMETVSEMGKEEEGKNQP